MHVFSSASNAAGLLVNGGGNTIGTPSTDSGEILIGSNTAAQGRLKYDRNQGQLYIENSYNDNTTGILFRTKTSATAVDAMTILGSGNVGIGTTAPGVKAHLYNASGRTDLRVESVGGDGNYATLQMKGGGSNAWWTIFTNSSAIGGAVDNLAFYKEGGTAGTKMVIQDNGNVGIGTTSPSTKLEVVGTVTCTTLTETSTIRIKENIEEIINPLDIVKKLRGIQYNKIGNNNKEIGVIAEEVDEVLPQIVTRDTDGNPTSVSYGRLTALLIEVVKKQDEQIENLTKRIEELENKL